MSLYANASSRVVVQGVMGRQGSYHTSEMMKYGTQVVAGVSPGNGGEWVIDEKVPIFDTVQAAVEITEADVSAVFVPPRQALDALYEAADSGVKTVVCITKGIPIHDVSKAIRYMKTKDVRLIGPNCSGLLTPGEIKLGTVPNDCAIPGRISIISRSGTLSHSIMRAMKKVGIGVRTYVGIGGDVISGTTFIDALNELELDPYTEAVLIIGETGGKEEERAAQFIPYHMTKPVGVFLAGQCDIPGKQMAHSGAFIEAGVGALYPKQEAFEAVGIPVCTDLTAVMDLVAQI